MSISKKQFKLINSLSQKKYREKHGLFVAEGVKVVHELLQSPLEVMQLFVVNDYEIVNNEDLITRISEADLKKISKLRSPNKLLGIFKIPKKSDQQKTGLIVALDEVNDPGNLGTIIRLCDWFGIQQLICSTTTVDCYNQKVVQASMGSLSRVFVTYLSLPDFLSNTKLPTFIADMNGDNVYDSLLPKEGVLVMGNEANGISNEIRAIVKHKISIPQFGKTQKTESLNVATATAILLSEFKRR